MTDADSRNLTFDAVFVGIGRELQFDSLQLENAEIEVKEQKIAVNNYLRTSNKNVYVCGDVAGDLIFSHAAEFHARILINNFLSPFKRKLNNDHMSWVSFTDPEVATFGMNEKQLNKRNVTYKRLEQDFNKDDRAVIDNYQYAKMILYITPGSFYKKEKDTWRYNGSASCGRTYPGIDIGQFRRIICQCPV